MTDGYPNLPTDDLADLESLVRGAGAYLQASDDLRPRVLEAAREATTQQRNRRRVARWSLVAAALWLLVGPLQETASPRPTSAEAFENRILQHTAHGSDYLSACYEALVELRSEQAQRLRAAGAK